MVTPSEWPAGTGLAVERLPVSGHPAMTIRRLESRDLSAWFDYLRMPQVHEHTSWDVHTPDDLLPQLGAPTAAGPATAVRYALVTRADDRLIGTAGFHSASPADGRAEIAYDLAPGYWGQGFASSACEALLRWAGGPAGLHRIDAKVLPSNRRSIRVLVDHGFHPVRLLPDHRSVRGTLRDFWLYSRRVDGPAVEP